MIVCKLGCSDTTRICKIWQNKVIFTKEKSTDRQRHSTDRKLSIREISLSICGVEKNGHFVTNFGYLRNKDRVFGQKTPQIEK